MVRYDLSDLDPSVRVEILRSVNERGILNTFVDGTLSVSDEFERIVDYIVEASEERGSLESSLQTVSREISEGVRGLTCEQCGRTPAASLTLRRQVGMVVVSTTETFDGVFCLPCGEGMRRYVQKQNAMKGWTGVKSAAMNPAIIATNERNFSRFRKEIGRGTD